MLQDAGELIQEAIERSRSIGRMLPPPHFLPANRLIDEDAAIQARRLNEAEAIAQVGSFYWDPVTDTLTWSEQHYRIFGVSPETFEPTYQSYLQKIFPPDLASAIGAIDGVLRDKRNAAHEYRIVRPNGEIRWVISRLRATIDKFGEVTSIQGTCQDITESKRHELMLASEHQVMEAILANRPLPQIMNEIALAVEQQAGDLRCALWQYDAAKNVSHLQAAPNMPEVYRATKELFVRDKAGTCGPAVHQRAMYVSEDVWEDPNWHEFLEFAREHHIRASWSIPAMSSEGQVLGSMTLYCSNPRRPTPYERQVMDRAVSLAVIAVERARHERELLASQQRYKLATTAGRVAVWEFNLETDEGYADFDWEGTSEYPGGGGPFALEAWLKIIHPDDLDMLLQSVDRCWAIGGPDLEVEHRVVRPDGQVRWQMARGTVERDAHGKPVRLVGTSTDITDRKQAEEEVAQLNQFYSALIRTAAEGICAFRIEPTTGRQHFLLWNEQMTRITGISMMDLYPDGWDPRSASTPDQLRLAAMVEQIASGRDLRAQHLEGYHPDGRERTISVSTSRVTDTQGKTTIVALVQDVTERARAERAACENEARFLQFADSIPHALWMFSADGSQQLFVNPGFERLFGGMARHLLVDPFAWVEALDPTDAPRVKELLAAKLTGPLSIEVRMHASFGENRWLELRMIPIFDQRHRATVYVGMAEEITALKQTEEQRDDMQSQLGNVTRLQAMGEIVAGIAHELAQPLTAIQNFASTCVELVEGDSAVQKVAKPELREYLQELPRQSVRASRIVSGFRNLSRRRPPQRERVTLTQLIDDTLSLMNAELRRRRVRVQVDSPQPTPELYIDCVQLQQVLINLIRNAADAMEDLPERQRRVTLSSCVEGHQVKIVCADRGPGLGDIDDNTLFRPFYTTKSDGTGMGLPICRSIIEGHGGSISFRNGQQQGAVFELTIPLT